MDPITPIPGTCRRALPSTRARPWRALLLAAALLLPTLATAGRRDADLALTEARAAVAAAERNSAPQYAPIELKAARDQLVEADGHYEDRDWTDAERAAQRGRHDAWLAEARSRQARSEALLAEIEAAIRTLQLEVGG